ncbi:MAG: M3 family metallopeptidase, partial [Flavobacteriales bacterium]|nr:M3 family metallopeptidase [Flavobacteriales bacterium]
MKKSIVAMAALGLMCACAPQNSEEMNPFFAEYDTPHAVPAFDKIKNEHYMPAFQKGMELHDKDIAAIVNNSEEPTFENTILAYENSGEMLNRVSYVFFNVNEAHTNDTLNAIAEEVTPLISAHSDNIALNEALFARIKSVYDRMEELGLEGEEARLTEVIYKGFERSGINLPAEKKEKLKEINSKLASLSLTFGNNVLKETNDYLLVLTENDLDGLPEDVKLSMAADAKALGKEGYVVTMQKPSWIPFVTYSTRRDLREAVIKAYVSRGNHDNDADNKANAAQMVNLRVEKAQLLGFDTWGAYQLDENMAKTPEAAYELMRQVWTPALKKAKEELREMQKIADREKAGYKIEAWDWWYYAEKLRAEKYALSEEITKPYFTLENTTKGIFAVCDSLYGISFVERGDMPVFHPDVKVYEVWDGETLMGVLYCDYFVRESKRPGAWMTDYRGEKYVDGVRQIPVVSLTCNFPKPVGDTPSLLSIDDVKTYFHEFGHCLHSLLTDVKYGTLAGTNVQHDFVELFSQIMERWAMHPEVLKLYAVHYQTGEVIPSDIVKKIEASSSYGQGFATTEFLAAGILDMDWHTRTAVEEYDVNAFEAESMKQIGLIKEIYPRYCTTYYNHIFSGGYSAGYYAYLWAEVLDADAFESFVENGIFDPETAKAFREKMLSKGNTRDAMELFVDFKGAEPSVKPLLKSRG